MITHIDKTAAALGERAPSTLKRLDVLFATALLLRPPHAGLESITHLFPNSRPGTVKAVRMLCDSIGELRCLGAKTVRALVLMAYRCYL